MKDWFPVSDSSLQMISRLTCNGHFGLSRLCEYGSQVLSDDIISRNDGWKFQRLDRIMILDVENFLSLCIFSTIRTVRVNSCASDLK